MLKRGAGESDQALSAIDAMALSTPRQPASRGLDDPGMGGVPPAAERGDVSHHSTTTHCRQCHTSPVLATVGPETIRWRPGADMYPVTAGDLRTPSCGVRRRKKRKSLSPLGCGKDSPFVRAPAQKSSNRAGPQLVLPKDAGAPDEARPHYKNCWRWLPKTREAVTESSRLGLS